MTDTVLDDQHLQERLARMRQALDACPTEVPASLAIPARTGMDEVAKRAIGPAYDLSLLTDATEASLARKLSEFPELVAGCARDRAPFRITHFCEELAAAFHGFYASCQVLPSEGRPVDAELSRARLAACDAVRVNLEVALRLIGVSAPDVM